MIAGWRRAGLQVAVSLLEHPEVRELALDGEGALCRESGIELVSFPTPDRGVPRSLPDTTRLVEQIAQRLRNGNAIGIHCRAAIGRSVLVSCGLPPAMLFSG